jgi:hypothetical protein
MVVQRQQKEEARRAILLKFGAADPVLDVVGPMPLPYQAIRLRLTLQNVGKKRLGPIGSVDPVAGAEVKGPGEWSYRGVWNSVLLFDSEHPNVVTKTQHLNHRAPLFLEPGEQSSASFAIAAGWIGRAGKLDLDKPLFPKPGRYSLKGFYGIDGKRELRIEATREVEIKEPQGDDKKILEMLEKDEELAAALLCPVNGPPAAVRPKLIQIIKDYSKSSYAPYAHFALARLEFGGIGFQPAPFALPKRVADELEPILFRRFPYQPNVIVMMLAVEPGNVEVLAKMMNKEYPDALEWLEYVAPSFHQPDRGLPLTPPFDPKPWQEFRKTKPTAESKPPRLEWPK